MRDKFANIVDLSKLNEKRDLLALIGRLQGHYRVSLEPAREGRSLQQNKYYHSCFVRPLYDYLRARQWHGTQDEVHMLFRAKLLPQVICDPESGEMLTTVPRSTRRLSIVEFTEFLERAREWLEESFGIIVAEANQYA